MDKTRPGYVSPRDTNNDNSLPPRIPKPPASLAPIPAPLSRMLVPSIPSGRHEIAGGRTEDRIFRDRWRCIRLHLCGRSSGQATDETQDAMVQMEAREDKTRTR